MKNIKNYYLALCALFIWDPSKMDFIRDKNRRGQQRLFYRTMGIVQHDRFLNDDPRAGTSLADEKTESKEGKLNDI